MHYRAILPKLVIFCCLAIRYSIRLVGYDIDDCSHWCGNVKRV